MNEDKILRGMMDFQPLLKIRKYNDRIMLEGTYQINETIMGEWYLRDYNVKIVITRNYPRDIPKVYSYGSKLSKCEHRGADGLLCLEASSVLKRYLKTSPTLKDFLEKFLTPFFAGFSYFLEHGIYPFGERRHDRIGILDMYCERFNVKNEKTALALLSIIVQKKYRGHILCPCNSGKRLRNCHGMNGLLINMVNSPEHEIYINDFAYLSKKSS